MADINRYTDREIADAIQRRDARITHDFLYRKCYPLFKSINDKYYTDCETPVELINQIYVYILLPKKSSGTSKLQDFGFRCTLTMWLKIVTENYCRQLFGRRMQVDENNDTSSDRLNLGEESLVSNTRNLDMADVKKLLKMMPNRRYSRLIEYRYIEEKSNDETAALMEMTMDNYYNCHRRAKAQYCEVLRKEGLL